MEMYIASQQPCHFKHLKLENAARRLFDEQGQEEMASIFRSELKRYQVLFNETFGMHSQQQKQICFLCEGLIGCAVYFEVNHLQRILHQIKNAACKEKAGRNLLEILNQEINFLLLSEGKSH